MSTVNCKLKTELGTRRLVAIVLASAGVLGVYALVKERMQRDSTGPNVAWVTASPEAVGLRRSGLESLQSALAANGTNSLLIVRDGKLVLEWYRAGHDANVRQGLAAAAKGPVGSLLIAAAVSAQRLALDDEVARFIPQWAADPVRSRITARQIASHTSGLDDVNFAAEQTGWKLDYYRDESLRFRYAIELTPILFEPGSRMSYSGVGYYVLAYTLARAMSGTAGYSHLEATYRTRFMEPLGIPPEAWMLSYGNVYDVDNMRLHAIGSGASFTARALARVGQLMLQNGEWEGERLVDSSVIRELLRSHSPVDRSEESHGPPAGLGWWVNSTGFFNSLPNDAFIAAGGGHQILLVVPSLNLVAVRLGESLGQSAGGLWPPLEEHFFLPLIASVFSLQLTVDR